MASCSVLEGIRHEVVLRTLVNIKPAERYIHNDHSSTEHTTQFVTWIITALQYHLSLKSQQHKTTLAETISLNEQANRYDGVNLHQMNAH